MGPISVFAQSFCIRMFAAFRSGKTAVFRYLSCHSQMVLGCPQFIPSDASRWGDGYSIFDLVRKISEMKCKGVRIHVMLNGCMEFPGPLGELIWWWKYGIQYGRMRMQDSRKQTKTDR